MNNKNLADNFFYCYFGDENLDKVNKVAEKVFNMRNNLVDNTKEKSESSDAIKKKPKEESEAILLFNKFFKLNLKSGSNSEDKYIKDDIMTNFSLLSLFIRKAKSSKPSERNLSLQSLMDDISTRFPNSDKESSYLYLKRIFLRFLTKKEKFQYLSCQESEEFTMDNIVGTYKELFCSICLNFDCKVHYIKSSKEFDAVECYDKWIYKETFTKMNEKKKSKETLAHCSVTCYLNKYMEELPEGNESHVRDLMFEKLFSIFKYDPCAISAFLTTTNDSNLKISCFSVYRKLLSKNLNDVLKSLPEIKSVNNKVQKKKSSRLTKLQIENIKKAINQSCIPEYVVCIHKGFESCNQDCPCSSRGFCEKYCVCNKNECLWRFSYCKCTSKCTYSSCPCFAAGRECDPLLCEKCSGDKNKCENNKVRNMLNKKCAISNSQIVGWGLFALEDLKKNEFIREYVGELIDGDEVEFREQWNKVADCTYMFDLNEQHTVDSKYIGNILRFANHSKKENLMNAYVRIVFSEGKHKICLYALKDIKKYDEIFFDYDGKDHMKEAYDWINDKTELIKKTEQIKKSRNNKKQINKAIKNCKINSQSEVDNTKAIKSCNMLLQNKRNRPESDSMSDKNSYNNLNIQSCLNDETLCCENYNKEYEDNEKDGNSQDREGDMDDNEEYEDNAEDYEDDSI